MPRRLENQPIRSLRALRGKQIQPIRSPAPCAASKINRFGSDWLTLEEGSKPIRSPAGLALKERRPTRSWAASAGSCWRVVQLRDDHRAQPSDSQMSSLVRVSRISRRKTGAVGSMSDPSGVVRRSSFITLAGRTLPVVQSRGAMFSACV